jgi:3-dehydroquinate dehydratase-2
MQAFSAISTKFRRHRGQIRIFAANSLHFYIPTGQKTPTQAVFAHKNRISLQDHSLMATILVLHGPNLNLLGLREPGIYGATTLEDINRKLTQTALDAGHHLQTLQSNAEYELIDRIHDARKEGVDFIIINPAAFTHTSVALRDALLGVGIPFIEVHLSNVHKREAFRQHSYFSDVAQGVICGFGATSYDLALQAAFNLIK